MNDLSPPSYLDEGPAYGEVISPARTTQPKIDNPFTSRQQDHISAGTVAVESKRAAAEVQGRMIVAKQWPRDSAAAYARAMESCRRGGLAECALYLYDRGGSKIEGPSIRLAEELARCWTNIEFGLRELSRREGESEMEAFAWDVETNVRSSQNFTVRHLRDRKVGAKALTDERDIYEITANMGARRLRARILAILPPELVDDAVETCRTTIKRGGGKSLGDRIRMMTTAFAAYDVTPDMIISRIGHPIDHITPDELVDLRGILQSLKENASTVKDWFSPAMRAQPAVAADADAFEQAASGVTVRQTEKGGSVVTAPAKSGSEQAEVKQQREAAGDLTQDAMLQETTLDIVADLVGRIGPLKTIAELDRFLAHPKTAEAVAKFQFDNKLTGQWLRAIDARRKAIEGAA